MSIVKIDRKDNRLALPPMLYIYSLHRIEPVTFLYSSSSHTRGIPLIYNIIKKETCVKVNK